MKYPVFARYIASHVFELHPEIWRLRRHLRALLGAESVLEAGSGFGTNAPLCRGEYLGLERDPDLVRWARRRFPERHFICADATGWRGPAGAWHTGLLVLALHEAADRPALLRAVGRLAAHRILLCDYDPDLRGLSRLRVMWQEEPGVETYFGLRPEDHLRPLGYRPTFDKRISALLRVRVFERTREQVR